MLLRLVALLVLLLPLAGCGGESPPEPVTAADSLAVAIADAHGGLEAYAALDVLRFDFVVRRDTAEASRRRHLWDRRGDRARVEWSVGRDSTVVALFAPSAFVPDAPAGEVALDGRPVADSLVGRYLVDAHRAHINDTYWLLAPMKTMDPGVRRRIVSDSAGTALRLSFDGVGLTPGDQYWLQIDPATRAMTGWNFRLEGDTTLGSWAWTEPQPVPTPRGDLRLPAVKVSADGARRIETRVMAVPDDEALWTDLSPLLR